MYAGALNRPSSSRSLIVTEEVKLKFKGGSRRQAVGGDLSVESFEPYFQRIAEVLAEFESVRLQVIDSKPAGKELAERSTTPS